ncbi:MAG TPA: CheR family methyltransferase [Vicinamibacterales bacterium]|nr:CheR family methyltransferase [Vicinamibacterales bacterium]
MDSNEFLIVGIGASAGGIRAFKEFFENVPADSGIAYVLVLHLSPEHESHLAEVLQVSAAIPVIEVRDRVLVEPNHVYVISPNVSMTLLDGHLAASEITRIEERRAPVDVFFRTLADAHGAYSVCVVLSGTGANGSMGLKRVKERGGICLVQDPDEADYPDMPRHAIATELVDQVLPVVEMPARILAYRDRLGTVRIPEEPGERVESDESALREIFARVRTRTGHDFTNYKRATVLRRIERRIGVHQLTDLPSYAHFVQERPEEASALLKDLLISVTSFFRDPDAFAALERTVLPRIFASKGEDDQVRVWVAGCATGEEAYSIAMLLTEFGANVPGGPSLQVFATDIDEAAVAIAREGLYTLNDAADVSPERLRRFFTKEGERYRVRKEIREIVLFAHHNLIKDPPFSHLDLVSCRNLLIYLNRAAQNRVIEVLHFAVNPNGYLLLGSSESVDGAGDLFAIVDKSTHLFQSRAVPARFSVSLTAVSSRQRDVQSGERSADARGRERPSFPDLHQRLLEQYAPPSVVVNEEHDIVHLSERVGRYLQFGGGEPSQNVLRVVRPEIRLELRTALYQAAQNRTNVEARGLKVRVDGHQVLVDLFVKPVLRAEDPARGFFLIVFNESDESGDVVRAESSTSVSTTEPARHLEDELIRLKSQLRATIEQHETQAEELKASNEELQAINEELRSATEELETSKEELQSVNEELRTVNQELKVKIEEQSQANNDIQNLVNSTDIGTIFLDRSSRIKLFTPRARDIFSLIPTDRGRPLSDINSHLVDADLQTDIDKVLDDLERIEREVQTKDGRWQLMRLAPYRTYDERIDGVVMTFVDVTERRASEQHLRDADRRKNEFLATLAHELRNPLAPLRTALDILNLPDVSAKSAEQARITMRRQLTHLMRLVDDLLDISRITLDKVTLRRERISLAECVNVAVEANQPLIDRAGQDLTVTLPQEPLYLDADPVRISQSISNLINNATKYTSQGGSITIAVTREDGRGRISVKDDGRGLNADVLPHIFDIFMQVTDDGSPQSGLGLGLTLVRALIRLHGGTVEAHSAGIGHGSEFVIKLPLASGPSAVRNEPVLPGEISRHRIVVVDDNEDTSNSLGLLLSMLGADVRVVYDAASALALIDSYRPTVMILDIGMPVMNGIQLAKQIRQRRDGNITLVAISGWGQEQDKKRALEVFDHFFTKPVGMNALQEVLNGPGKSS